MFHFRPPTLLVKLALVAVVCLALYFSAGNLRTDSMVGTWRASVRMEIDGKPAGAMPVLWKLNADGTAQYGRIPGDVRDGKWRVVRRQGDKRIVRYEIRGQVGIQIFIFESPDQFKLISDVEENGKELVTLNELPMGGLVFHRIKE